MCIRDSSSRVCKEAVKKARAKGVKLGLIRLITAWPFPEKAFAEIDVYKRQWAFDAVQAFYLLESIEYDAKVTMNLRLMGIERLMTEEQTDELIALRADWGVIKGGRPKSR